MASSSSGGSHFRRSGAPSDPESESPRPSGKRFRTADDQKPTHRSAREDSNRHARAEGVKPAYTRSSRRAATASKSSKRPIVISVVVIAAVVVAAIIIVPKVYRAIFGTDEEETYEAGVEVTVTIPEGASGDEIASILSESHVIEDPSDYYTAVTQLGAESSLMPGVYLFTTGQDPLEVVNQLMEGSNVDGYTLVVSEGLTVEQTAAVVEESLGIPVDEFLAQATVSNYVDEYSFLETAADDSLEGFLYPKTYTFTEEPTADAVIRTMLDQYEEEVASLDFDAAVAELESRYGVTMSEYDILILASIVEREALTSDQRLNIASVFYNRLSQDMALQSDATMGYVTGGEVTASDLETESAYNTYLNKGLTPTPICSPSLESIEAAMDPAETDYLYFYITTETEYFSETYDEHLQAIEEENS